MNKAAVPSNSDRYNRFANSFSGHRNGQLDNNGRLLAFPAQLAQQFDLARNRSVELVEEEIGQVALWRQKKEAGDLLLPIKHNETNPTAKNLRGK